MTPFPLVARRSPRGFTLIELLTVIAIIGILAAIIIPTVGKVRQTAKNAQCLSNLRQIGLAFNLYPQDNKGYYPRTSENLVPGVPNPANWAKALSPYLPSRPTLNLVVTHPIFLCPAETEIADPSITSSVNHYISSYALENSNSAAAAAPGNTNGPRQVQAILNPSKTYLIVDAKVDPTTKTAITSNAVYSVAQTDINANDESGRTKLSFRHQDSINALFVDGHTAKFSLSAIRSDLTADAVLGAQRWNGK